MFMYTRLSAKAARVYHSLCQPRPISLALPLLCLLLVLRYLPVQLTVTGAILKDCPDSGLPDSVLGTWYLIPGIWYQVPGTLYQVPGTWYLVPGIWYLVPGTGFRIPD